MNESMKTTRGKTTAASEGRCVYQEHVTCVGSNCEDCGWNPKCSKWRLRVRPIKMQLAKGRGMTQEIAALEALTARALEAATKTTTSMCATPKGSGPEEHKFDGYIILAEQLQQKKAELAEERRKIVDLIYLLDKPVYRELLLRRYVDEETWQSICDEMGYSESNIKRLHKKALTELSERA